VRWEFHPDALQEYREAARYYAEHDPKLGLRFADAVEEAIHRIIEAPLAWRVLEDDVRRCRTRRFPYGVLYSVDADIILIVAVMHGSREPGYWRSRVDAV